MTQEVRRYLRMSCTKSWLRTSLRLRNTSIMKVKSPFVFSFTEPKYNLIQCLGKCLVATYIVMLHLILLVMDLCILNSNCLRAQTYQKKLKLTLENQLW